jgi:hypothetical protein
LKNSGIVGQFGKGLPGCPFFVHWEEASSFEITITVSFGAIVSLFINNENNIGKSVTGGDRQPSDPIEEYRGT